MGFQERKAVTKVSSKRKPLRKYLFLVATYIGNDRNKTKEPNDSLLAPPASNAEMVKLKVDDGKMTNDLNYLGKVID